MESSPDTCARPGATKPEATALANVLRTLLAARYRFTATTPLTHQRVLARRAGQVASGLRDIFGWNMPFAASSIDPALLTLMDRSGILRPHGPLLRSAVRMAAINGNVFVHSAYPTVEDDSVFFGPDTYRFVQFVERALPAFAARFAAATSGRGPVPLRLLDVGCGSGAGGIVAAQQLELAGMWTAVTMNDINPLALRFATVNADVAAMPVELALGDALAAAQGKFDLIISNPPYMADASRRAYRDGGRGLGRELSVRIVAEALPRLAPGGQLLLYTGAAIVDGVDPLVEELAPLLRSSGCDWSYAEIDPDVFGEELEQPAYASAERIAVVGLIANASGKHDARGG